MWPFRKRRKEVTFRRPEQDGFRLETSDVEERGRLFGWWRRRRGRGEKAWAHYLSASGGRDAREPGETEALMRSWGRFQVALFVIVAIWLLGVFL